MSAYHQLGHNSHNLVSNADLSRFRGVILSPVNYTEQEIGLHARGYIQTGLDVILDPQLYVPTSQRMCLPGWSYFPSDLETADLSDRLWWLGISEKLAQTCRAICPSAVASPIFVPKVYDDNYYLLSVDTANMLVELLDGDETRVILTAIVNLPELSSSTRVMEIASILTRADVDGIYLLFVSDLPPRRELREADELENAMRLISTLEGAGQECLIGYCSTEMLLWKAAGATHCASGKFFNLRRFTRTRFDEPAEGGRQLSYFFEESLLSLFRENDVSQLLRYQYIDVNSRTTPFDHQILSTIETGSGEAWLALGWRQNLYAFSDLEYRIASGDIDIQSLLKSAEDRWNEINDDGFLPFEQQNDGTWLRHWRIALNNFTRL